MNRDEAIAAASRAAQSVLRSMDARAGAMFHWTDALDIGACAMAQFIDARRDTGPADLYAFAVASQPNALPWLRCHPAQRAAVAIFHGTYRVLLDLVEVDAASPTPVLRHVDFRRRH